MRRVRFEMLFGRPPEKELNWRWRPVREGRERRSEGNGPVRALERRLRIWRAERWERVLGGMGPPKPMPGRRRATTREPSGLQVTPVQKPQTGVAGSQLSGRTGGEMRMKSRRDCLSAIGSATEEQNRKRKDRRWRRVTAMGVVME